ncbi:MFS transporter [Chloroflexota bacterium]
MVAQVFVRYWERLTSFSPNARFYLLSEVIIGLSYGIYALVFNLYVDSMGYPRTFLGELQSLPNLIALFGAVPAGVLVDYIGRKKALLLAGLGHTVATLGIVLAPDASWLRLSMILFGAAGALWMVTSSPFLMENSKDEERNALFAAHFGLTTLVGFFGTLMGGYLPTLLGGLQDVDVESPAAYAATLGVIVLLSSVSLLPLGMIKEKPRLSRERASSVLPWRNITDRGMAARIFVPNIVISMGAAILIPYMNLFFKESFRISDKTLGMLFAISAVITGTATLASPIMADRWGRIRALVMTQLASIPFLLMIGFAPGIGFAVFAFWMRAALMNMGGPLYDAFAMEQVAEKERATISGLMGMSWNLGWTIGPYLSGVMQDNPNIGWKPIFVITCVLYATAAVMVKVFFQRLDDRQRREALLKKLGVVDAKAGNVG